ncbi:MAG TPA: DNA primase, partial [Cyanobacteria bacterium UBA8553]|nr:DNA primase [Cyanobacteria bacterium UBA8553]
PGMRAVYSKMEGYIGRLALNLHILNEIAGGKELPASEIPLQPMERAIALAKFYIGQVKLIHANCSADLGELAPHLVKVVELSKRMDSTTGISWIKAKVVQSGYDSRHRPRPDAVRSWFRELEALGIGTT